MPSQNLEYKLFYRRNLPHIQPPEAMFFITYRLAFRWPQNVLQKIQNEKDRLRDKFHSDGMRRDKLLFDIYDTFMCEQQDSPQWLNVPEIARIVLDNLKYHHGKRYDLILSLVMPNHVHTVLRPVKDNNFYPLQAILKNHKNFTALKANQVLGRKGQFWHHESYDHYIRDEKEFRRIIDYILENPVKARLVDKYQDWPYYWVNEEYL